MTCTWKLRGKELKKANLTNEIVCDCHLPSKFKKCFDELFINQQDDIAVYAHIHQQLLRYSSKG